MWQIIAHARSAKSIKEIMVLKSIGSIVCPMEEKLDTASTVESNESADSSFASSLIPFAIAALKSISVDSGAGVPQEIYKTPLGSESWGGRRFKVFPTVGH